MKTNTNKSKTIILTGLSCLTVTLGALVATRNMNTVRLVRSEIQRTITLNASTLVTNSCYTGSSTTPTDQYAIFQLGYPGSYAVLNDYSNGFGAFGGSHLYSQTMKTAGYGYRIILGVDETTGLYFDKQHNQPINCPQIRDLRKIVLTLSSENTYPFNESYFSNKGLTVKSSEDKLTYTIEGVLTSKFSGVTLMGTTATAEDVGKKIVIDQIYLEYNC